MPYKIVIFYKINILCDYKFNKRVLSGFKKEIVFNNLGYSRHTNNVKVPLEKTKFGLARLSVFFRVGFRFNKNRFF